MLRKFLNLQRDKRYKLEKAIKFRKNTLVVKGMKVWKKYMSDNYELFIKRKALLKRLKERNCPLALKKWSMFAENHKVFRLKNEKAETFNKTQLMKKAFLCFNINTQERKDFRILYKKAYLFH